MPYTPLDRQFRKWRGDKADSENFSLFERGFYGDAGWSELLKYQRVVVLAEAGSGKSRELEEKAKALEAACDFAFHSTVQNVARDGLAVAIGSRAAKRLADWLESTKTAWFFIDSIDEAKLDHIKLSEALRRLADGIGDGLPRARIILSGRYNNWEFRADLERLLLALPLAASLSQPTEHQLSPIIQIIRNERQTEQEKAAEKPLVVLMAPLDEKRVRIFAHDQGVTNVDTFIAAIDTANLWSLAQRPMDLGWLVDYWSKNSCFGRFAEMLETSLRQRLGESDVSRAGRDIIDVERAFLALERIGTTMVFGRDDRLELPDSNVDLASLPALKLHELLPDWPGEHQARLLTRPVFDPASLGRLRLHNDNEGVVRGFLTARWLHRRLQGNAPITEVFDLLFGEADGLSIVLPSAQETGAWLSIWEPTIASEVIRRDPALLLTAGDPGSLDRAVRVHALQALIDQLAAGHNRHGLLDPDTLRRFATPDLVPAVRESWERHKDCDEVRRLLLHIVELGRLKDCALLAVEAVSGSFDDRSTLLFGARALAVTATDVEIGSFIELTKDASSLANEAVLWETFDLFFPRFLSVDDFLAIVARISTEFGRTRQLRWQGQNVIERLASKTELERLLQGLMRIAVAPVNADNHAIAEPQDRRLAALVQAAASRLIQLTPLREANRTVIDAAIWLTQGRHHPRRFEDEQFLPMLCASAERRRLGLWHAAFTLEHHPSIVRWSETLTNIGQLELAGWSPGLRPEDVTWLLEDARLEGEPLRRRLAIDALLRLWRDANSPDALLQQIRAVAATDSETVKAVEAWLTPRRLSPEEVQFNRSYARSERRRATQQLIADQSWIDFIDKMKSDPRQLRIPPIDLKPGHIDGRLFGLWQLLYQTFWNSSGYAIDEFGDLAGILGPDLCREMRDAIVKFWHGHTPTLTSSRPANARNQVNSIDCMAIAGVSFEAKDDPDWARKLSPGEATIAAQLSTLELNGFPHWLKALAATWFDQVRDVFLIEVNDHRALAPGQHGFIDKIAHAGPEIAALLSPATITYVTDHLHIAEVELAKALDLIGTALPITGPPTAFLSVALARFTAATNDAEAALYLGFCFRLEPAQAIQALSDKLNALKFPSQKRLVEHVLPRVFGDRMFQTGIDPKVLPFDVLQRLVNIAFRTIRHEDDNVHESSFTPDQRDAAERARSDLFNQLLATPGRPTLDALKRLGQEPSVPITPGRLAGMILKRAAEDAEHAPWVASEAHAMEQQFDTAPRTPHDLQLVALRRISNISHDLYHAEFAQGQTVKALPNEREVQKWIATALRQCQGRAYTLTREPHVVDEKEPDIRFQSNATEASMPIEIKVAESWSLADLRAALVTQLAGRYLRVRDQRHGVLLLVHQKTRPKGWPDGAGLCLSFTEVVATLRSEAEALGACDVGAACVKIAVIDVSGIYITPVGKRKSGKFKLQSSSDQNPGHEDGRRRSPARKAKLN